MLHVFLGFVSALTAVLDLIQTQTFPVTSSYLHYIAVLSFPWLTHIPSFSKATQTTMPPKANLLVLAPAPQGVNALLPLLPMEPLQLGDEGCRVF